MISVPTEKGERENDLDIHSFVNVRNRSTIMVILTVGDMLLHLFFCEGILGEMTMDMKEKLIELLEYCVDEYVEPDDPYDGLNVDYGNFADHIIADGWAKPEWISVKDRLPEDICPVLVALEGLNIAFHGWYQDEKWWKVGAGSRPFAQKVTHWMPLPQPPKGE